jgi:hypothetical protein
VRIAPPAVGRRTPLREVPAVTAVMTRSCPGP